MRSYAVIQQHILRRLREYADDVLRFTTVNKETIAVLEAAAAQGERPRLSASEIMTVAKRFAALPVLDSRSADEILDYDHNGLPS